MSKSIRTFARTLTLTLATLLGTASVAAAADSPAELTVQTGQSGEDHRFDAAATVEGEVNINTASAAELEMLPGIGPAIAGRIVSFRTDHPFKQRNHIMRVKGVGQKTFARIKDHLIVEGATTLKIVK